MVTANCTKLIESLYFWNAYDGVMSRIFILGFVCQQTILHVEIEESLCVYYFLTNTQQFYPISGLGLLPTKVQGMDFPTYKSSKRAVSFTHFPFLDFCRATRGPAFRGSHEYYTTQSGSLIYKATQRVTKLHGPDQPYSNVPQSQSLEYIPQSGMALPLSGTEEEAAAFTATADQDGGLKSKSSTRFGPPAKVQDVVKSPNQVGTALDDKGREMQLLHASGAIVTSYPVASKPMGFTSGL